MAGGEATGRRGVADFLFLEEIHHHLSFDMLIYLATLRVNLFQKFAILVQAMNSLLHHSSSYLVSMILDIRCLEPSGSPNTPHIYPHTTPAAQSQLEYPSMFDKICSPRVEWRINFVPACSSPSEWISSNRKHSRPSRPDNGPVYHIYRSKEDENKHKS